MNKEFLNNKYKTYSDLHSDVIKTLEPRRFDLLKENINNVRNSIVVCATLATVNLLIISNIKNDLNLFISVISTVLYLIPLFAYSLYLMRFTGDSIKNVTNSLDLNTKHLEEILYFIRDNAHISQLDFEKKEDEILKKAKVDLEQNIEGGKQNSMIIKIFAIVGNYSFGSAIILTIVNLILYFIFNACK